ncbi:RNA polymerase sigma factor [Kibdelosporangium phytohabitans]|uniref:RNA polymerase subunit sigma-70 n=1 Tax=Kibdelosporangium phytohabitans TaxID=860235 RepID=A0A0N9I2Q1_9PSEU|nr:sigma-70 family RNA polymerase sigma factor [Kibdelosporangium phytohabitans]ALG08740.1 RNA polymerase subunit sigma-70 [Kibdelosporangium phytohabitans]MBE1470145.1 RNA polymerase sigma-70 factor (ECF subfamily) [Kibdelosporangium phytohabitans]
MTTDSADGDGELWSRAAADGGEAFAVLFDRHAKAVYNHCFRLTASWAAAEDHVQSTFLVAWRKRGEMKLERDSALPWLLMVATNVVRNDRRGIARRLRLTRQVPVDAPVPDHADDVARRVDDQRRMAEVLDAVNELPRNEREALAMCVWSGVSYPDAAAVLGITEGSVRARVSKAKSRLSQLLPTATQEAAR